MATRCRVTIVAWYTQEQGTAAQHVRVGQPVMKSLQEVPPRHASVLQLVM